MDSKKTRDELREKMFHEVMDILKNAGWEILQDKSNRFCTPCVDSDGNEWYFALTGSIPLGERGGKPYDGYTASDDYKDDVLLKQEQAKIKAEAKAKKIAEDTAKREQKKKEKEMAKLAKDFAKEVSHIRISDTAEDENPLPNP